VAELKNEDASGNFVPTIITYIIIGLKHYAGDLGLVSYASSFFLQNYRLRLVRHFVFVIINRCKYIL